MSNVLDAADRVFWWLRDHLAIAALLVAGLIALAVFAVTSGGGAGSQKIPTGAVAVVGSAPITEARLSHWQGVYTQSATAAGAGTPTAPQTRKAAFELLAGAQWIIEEAKKEDVSVSDAQVGASIDAYFQQTGATGPTDRAAVQKQLGATEEDMRFQQRVSLLAAKLQDQAAAKVAKPSPEAIKAVYEKEPGRWATPSQRDIRAVIVADRATAAKARAALQKGDSFAAVNKQFAANKNLVDSGGVIKGLKNGQSGDAVDRAVFGAQPGVLSEPVDTGVGWMVFKVQKSTPLLTQSLQQATRAISNDLLATAKAKAAGDYLAGLRKRWKAKTRCAAPVAEPAFCGATPS